MSSNYSILTGSICLTDIPKDRIKRVICKDGKERCYLNVSVIARKTPNKINDRTYTHFLSCAPRKEERREGVNYIIGDLETRVFDAVVPVIPTPDSVSVQKNFVSPTQDEDTPF